MSDIILLLEKCDKDAKEIIKYLKKKIIKHLEGIVYELQRVRLHRNSLVNFRIPCCLLLSDSGRPILYMDRHFQNRNMSLRTFELSQPGSVQ